MVTKKSKKIFETLFFVFLALLLFSCSKDGDKKMFEPIDGNDENGFFAELEGKKYELYKNGDGFSFRTDGFGNEIPAVIRVKSKKTNAERYYAEKYATLISDGNSVTAIALINTRTESVIEVRDIYTANGGMIDVKRTVSVIFSSGDEGGFSSLFALYSDGDESLNSLDWFIPGVWNKNTELEIGIIGTSYDHDEITVRDTSTGLPFVMARSIGGGKSVTLGRLNPVISSDISDRETPEWLVDENYLCGSVGMLMDKRPAAVYIYPASCEPHVYYSFKDTCKRFHPMTTGFSSSYTISIFASSFDDYNGAMQDSYIRCYSRQEKPEYKADLELVKSGIMTTFNDYWSSLITRNMTIYGLPYGCFLSDGHVESSLTMEMGFVGMELSVAYQMMRYGYETENEEFISRGRSMADMWAEYSGNKSGTLKVYLWSNGEFNPMPCYLRRMTDGMEGMLDCVVLGEEKNIINVKNWKKLVLNYADFLVREQNSDGSFYRAYDNGGKLFTEDNRWGQSADIEGLCAESKTSTPIPIRFLIRMYEYTGDKKYLDSALKAGQYCLDVLVPMGKYAGATVDGKLRTDRETGIFAMYGFSALYAVSGEQKWLDAAKQAAVYSASWTLLYDFKAVHGDEQVKQFFTDNAVSAGLSLITCGQSGIDNFMAYTYFDYYRLYVWTGEEFYRDFAEFIANCTKRTMNYDGHMGYKSPGLAPEAIALCDFEVFMAGKGVKGETGVWLPWVSMSCLEPITRMADAFGTPCVGEADRLSHDELIERIGKAKK